jgi:peroxiredoxin
MNHKSAILSLAVAATLAASAAVAAKPAVGTAAPDFTVTDWNGQQHSLSDFSGKTVILEWTNHECPFVVKHYTGNMQAQQRSAAADGIVWLTINSSNVGKQGHVSAAKAKSIMGEHDAAQTAYVFDTDGKVGRAYGALVTPHMYVIDGDGVLRYNGAIDSIPSANPADIGKATQYVVEGLAMLAKDQDPNPTLTQPYGCTIKY